MTLTIWERIENARQRWDVLRHPFYQPWNQGALTAEELARYSGQYRHAVEAIATLSDRAADRAVSNLFSSAPVGGFPVTARVTSATTTSSTRRPSRSG